MSFQYTGFADEAGKTLAEQIKVLKELGWTGLEARLLEGVNFTDLSDEKFDAALDTLQAAGIKIVCFGAQLANWSRPITSDFKADLDELDRALPRMQKAGAKIIRCMSYPNDEKEPWPEDKWKAEVFRRLKELARRCEDAGVILGHENCSGYGGVGARECQEMIEGVDSPAFKIAFDTGNNTSHDKDREATWSYYEAAKGHIAHVHVKAYKPVPDGKWATCYPDEDPVQLRVLSDLKASGYDGWLSIEPHMAAAVHAGKDVDDANKAASIWVEYGRRLMKLVEQA
jgi:sugar phosphate isomerase/epimerase